MTDNNNETQRMQPIPNFEVHYKCQTCEYLGRCPLPYAPKDTFHFRAFCIIRQRYKRADKMAKEIREKLQDLEGQIDTGSGTYTPPKPDIHDSEHDERW